MRQKHPIIPTAFGKEVFRARLSLHETQEQFANRFFVSWMTIHRWETGKVKLASKVHRELLKMVTNSLKAEGRYLAEDIFIERYTENFERKEVLANDFHSTDILAPSHS